MTFLKPSILALFFFSPLLTQAKISTEKPKKTIKIITTRSDTERINFLIRIAQAYTKEGDAKSAVKAYEKILKINPHFVKAKYALSQAYIMANQEKKAEDILLKLIKKYPEDSKLWNNLAWLYATTDNLTIRNGKKALECAHEALVLSPNDYHIWDTLSEAYYISGDYEKAFRAAKQMAALATQYANDITPKEIKKYNAHIRKCQRAFETQKELDLNKKKSPPKKKNEK